LATLSNAYHAFPAQRKPHIMVRRTLRFKLHHRKNIFKNMTRFFSRKKVSYSLPYSPWDTFTLLGQRRPKPRGEP